MASLNNLPSKPVAMVAPPGAPNNASQVKLAAASSFKMRTGKKNTINVINVLSLHCSEGIKIIDACCTVAQKYIKY